MHISPANGALAVGGSLGHRQGLAHLGLGESQRQAPQLECLGELLDLVQVDAVHHIGGGLVDGGFIWWKRGNTNPVSGKPSRCIECIKSN